MFILASFPIIMKGTILTIYFIQLLQSYYCYGHIGSDYMHNSFWCRRNYFHIVKFRIRISPFVRDVSFLNKIDSLKSVPKSCHVLIQALRSVIGWLKSSDVIKFCALTMPWWPRVWEYRIFSKLLISPDYAFSPRSWN